MYFEATNPDFIDRITDGPHVPKKLVPREGTIPEHYVGKLKTEITQEEKLEIPKDAKVKNILHNSLDAIMSNRVIACKTSKEIWDTWRFCYIGRFINASGDHHYEATMNNTVDRN